jgi:hypothetical protein
MPGDVDQIFSHLTPEPTENVQQELRERREELRECRNHVSCRSDKIYRDPSNSWANRF